MVFELTDELMLYDDSDERLIIECISNLLLGYYESNHLLMASPLFCTYFSSLITETRASRALYHLNQHNSVYPDVLWTKKVRLDKNVVKGSDDLPISFFQKTQSVQPITLLCENLNDVKFYRRLCGEYHFNSNFIMNGIMGGGQSTVDTFRNLRGQRHISLTILDSDIRYPGAQKGGTATSVENANKKKLAQVGLYILGVHEVENLIPFDFLALNCKQQAKSFLTLIRTRSLFQYMRFYDVKNGIKTDDIVSNPGLYAFSEQLYDDLYPASKGKFTRHVKSCAKKDKEALKRKVALPGIFPALKASMLDDFLKSGETISRTDIFETDRKYIADLVFTYSCARDNDIIM